MSYDLKGERKAALATLLLRLKRIYLPVRHVVKLDFVAHMVLTRHLVNASFGRRVRYKHTGLGEGARRPDVKESAAATVRYPEARILAVPASVEVGVRVVVRILARTVGLARSVPAEKPNIINHRRGTCRPLHRDCAGVDAIRVEANTKQDIRAALRSFDQRSWSADALKRRCPIRHDDLGTAWLHPDESRIGSQRQGVGNNIVAGGNID